MEGRGCYRVQGERLDFQLQDPLEVYGPRIRDRMAQRLMWALCEVPLLCPGSRFSFQAFYVKPHSLSQLTGHSLQALPSLDQGPSQLLHLLSCGSFPFRSCQAHLQRASSACFRHTFGAQQQTQFDWLWLDPRGPTQGMLLSPFREVDCLCLFLLLSLDASPANLSRARHPQPVCDSH